MAGLVLEKVSRVFAGPRGTGLTHGRSDIVAVDELSLDVADGELVVLVGPSGCGKSTTLRLIAGLERPSSGQIRIGGRLATDLPARERNIAMVFQHDALYPHLTVEQNIEFGLKLSSGKGWIGRLLGGLIHGSANRVHRSADTAAQHVDVRQIAELLGVGHLLDRWPRQLSGGERQRVALARALVRRPALLLLDEPLSNLDAPLRAELRREIKRLHERLRATIVYVTHDQVEALTLGDRLVVLDRGIAQQIAAPGEIYARPRNVFVARFIGNPPMNLVAGKIELASTGVAFRSGEWQWKLSDSVLERSGSTGPLAVRLQQYMQSGEAVLLGFRPEHAELTAVGVPGADKLCGVVEVVEPQGDATVVTVRLKGSMANSVACKLGPQVAWQVGDAVAITIAAERIQLFDSASGLNLEQS